MRLILCVAIITVLLLAGCNSAPEPTATPEPPMVTAESTEALLNPDDLSEFAGTLEVSVPGTLTVSNSNETPGAPTHVPFSFASLIFSQAGGLANVQLVIELSSDGTVIRNGETSTASPERVDQINTLLTQIDFFNINGTFIDADAAADAYHYTLTVNGSQGSRTIFSQDGLTPPALFEVYDAIRTLGESS